MMTFMALPLAMTLTKYAILLFVILVVVPSLIRWLERDKPLKMLTADDDASCAEMPRFYLPVSFSDPILEKDHGRGSSWPLRFSGARPGSRA